MKNAAVLDRKTGLHSRRRSLFDTLEQRLLQSTSHMTSPVQNVMTLNLPDLQYTQPSSNPALPNGVQTFNPSFYGATVATGAPKIATVTDQAAPTNTISLTGAAFTSNSTGNFADSKFLIYGQTTSSNATLATATVETTSIDGVLTNLPGSDPSNSMYIVWAENSSGVSAPVAINRTQAQWVSSDNPAPGTTVSVYGRNLDNSSGQSWIYLQSASGQGQYVPVTSANPYCVQFTLPSTSTVGSTYQVWVHNGEGGKYGWSGPLNITVTATAPFSGQVNVKSFGATGNGTTDDGPAILKAISTLTKWETLYFPAGNYAVYGEQLHLPSDVRVMGDGDQTSNLNFYGNVPKTGMGNFEIGVYDFDYAAVLDFESIGLNYDGPLTGQSSADVVRERFVTSAAFNNVIINSKSIGSIDWENSNRLLLSNSTIIGNQLYVNGSQNVTLNNDLLLQGYDNFGQAGVTFNNVQNLSMTNTTTENLYDYYLSTNPNTPYDRNDFGEGRFIEFGGSMTNVYVANNKSINLGASATPANGNTGEQINVEGTWDVAYSRVTSASTTGFVLAGNQSTGVVGLRAQVTSGVGLGQVEVVSSAKYNPVNNTTSYTISGGFAVVPPAGSDIDIAYGPSNMVLYQNNLSHTTGKYAAEDTASAGIEFFEGGTGIVIDGNTVANTRIGVSLWSAGVSWPLDGVDVINNKLVGVQTGIDLFPDVRSDPNFYSVAVRGNTISGASTSYSTTVAGIDMNPFWKSKPIALAVFEGNTISGFPTDLLAPSDPASVFLNNSLVTANTGSNNSSGLVSFVHSVSAQLSVSIGF